MSRYGELKAIVDEAWEMCCVRRRHPVKTRRSWGIGAGLGPEGKCLASATPRLIGRRARLREAVNAERPILVVKNFNNNVLWTVPLTNIQAKSILLST